MVSVNLISRYEMPRARLYERYELLGIDAAVQDEELIRLDAELVELEKILPEDFRYLDEP